jgi:hypothetical protein
MSIKWNEKMTDHMKLKNAVNDLLFTAYNHAT